jgi:hypothetical protein
MGFAVRWAALCACVIYSVALPVEASGQDAPAGGGKPAAGAPREVRFTGRLLPEIRYLRAPLADPNAPRIAVGLMRTTLLATQGPERPPFHLPNAAAAAEEFVAAVGIGAVFPLLQLAEWDGGGAVFAVDGRVLGRFRLEYPTRDDMGQDWYVGGAIEAARHRWSGRLAIMHRSAHIGDEFAARTGAQRIEFGGEQLDMMAAYQWPGVVRVYGGGAWIFRSYLGWEERLRQLGIQDRALVQLGFDGEWEPWRDRRFHLLAGVEYFSAERTGWDPSFSAVFGAGVRTTRTLRLVLRAFDGKSHMGEFFLTPERYVSLEVGAKF